MARALALALAAGLALMMGVADASSQGSMAPEVRRVSPSIMSYGTVREIRKQRAFEAKEAVKLQNRMVLEEQKALHKRRLEADKAYYRRLELQRKGKIK